MTKIQKIFVSFMLVVVLGATFALVSTIEAEACCASYPAQISNRLVNSINNTNRAAVSTATATTAPGQRIGVQARFYDNYRGGLHRLGTSLTSPTGYNSVTAQSTWVGNNFVRGTALSRGSAWITGR